MKEFYPNHNFKKIDYPSNSWYEDWMTRNNMLHKHETLLEKERSMNATRGNIRDWFERIGNEIDFTKINKMMIGNLDETGLDSKGKSLVCVKKGTKYAITKDIDSPQHITILTLIINGGTMFKPLFVFQLTNMPTYLDDLVQNGKLFVSGQKKGWITEQSLGDYLALFFEWLPIYRKQIGGVPKNGLSFFLILMEVERTPN